MRHPVDLAARRERRRLAAAFEREVDPPHEGRRDDLEAAALYDLLERAVAPKFYDRDESGVPTRWVEMVRHTLKSLGPKVLATRQVRDSVRELYAPAAHTARSLNSDYAGARADFMDWVERNEPDDDFERMPAAIVADKQVREAAKAVAEASEKRCR